MKRLLSTILSTQLAFGQVALAGEHMDQARAAVQSSIEVAQQDAQLMVRQDLDRSLMQIMSEMAEIEDTQNIKESLLSLQDDLRNGFMQIEDFNPSEISQSIQAVKQIREKYRDLIRKRFEASFQAAETRQNFRKVLRAMTLLTNDFENQCKVGRSVTGLDYHKGLTFANLPEYQSRFKIGFNSNGTYDFEYESSNSSGSQAEKNLQGANTVLQTSASIAYSIGLSGSAAAGAGAGAAATAATTNAVISYAAAAAPYLIAVAVAVAVITEILMSDEQAKLQNDIANANSHLLRNMADDFDVNKFYTDACGKYTDVISSMQRTIELAQNPKERESLLARAKKTSKARIAWKNASAEGKKLTSLIQLNTAFNKKGCSATEPDAICEEDGKDIWLKSNNELKLPLNNKDREEIISQHRESIKKYDGQFKSDEISTYIEHDTAELLIEHIGSISRLSEEISWKTIDKVQTRAFKKLIQILAMYRQFKQGEENGIDDTVFSDLQAQVKLELLKKEYRSLISSMINNILGYTSTEKVKSQSQSLEKRVNGFSKKYFHVPSVRSFKRQFDNVRKYYESL